jgi:ABC-2 type transport system ATP-binding protein
MTNKNILLVENVSKYFDHFEAVSPTSFSVERGTIYALIGENGAGKTTLVKTITGLFSPDSGKVEIGGYNNTKEPVIAKRLFGYVPDNPLGYQYLTGYEYLRLSGKMHNMKAAKLEKRIKEVSNIFNIRDILPLSLTDYSRGNRQKLTFIAALLHEPVLLVIDEPIVGLDPESIEIFGNQLKEFAKNDGAVFFTTHIISFAAQYAHRVGIMKRGALVKEVIVDKKTDLNKAYKLVSGEK